jgi:hypothetical protein
MSIGYNDFELFKLILKKQDETEDKIQCLQRAMAMLCGQVSDFKAEHYEDSAELKQRLDDLSRNKVWIPRERA